MTIEERIEKIENELRQAKRRNRILLAGLAACVVATVFVWAFEPQISVAQNAANTPKEIRANQFVVEDEKGNMRVRLGIYNDSPRLSFFDEKGALRFGVLAQSDTQSLVMADSKGNTRIMMMVNEGQPGFSMLDEKDTRRIVLGVSSAGPCLRITDERGTNRAAIGAFITTGDDGTKTSHPESTLTLFGPDGKGLWKAP